MLFNSLGFIIFFAVVLLLYYVVPRTIQWQFLLAASLVFYYKMCPEFIFLLVGFIAVNFVGSVLIDESGHKKTVLVGLLVLDFGMLAVFKYLAFVSQSFGWLYSLLGREYPIKEFSLALPAGISFYTFLVAGYIIDIYKGKYKAERNFLKFATFISFFPQITAGPIERGNLLMPQLFTPKRLEADNISMGLKIMLWGYFKKLVIADRLSILVNTVFSSPRDFEGAVLLTASLLFTVQIYCDFSGYSDIARGCAKTLGIDLINNFDRPYFATSIRDFWRRWHISLSSWFRDYVYIPLGGNRVGVIRLYLNYLITFAASGIWHGASWTFVFWGALHGLYQVIGNIKFRLLGSKRDRKLPLLLKPFAIITTFALVSFAWIFFKASSISDGLYIASHLFDNIAAVRDPQYLYEVANSLGLGLFELVLAAIAILWLIFAELISFKYEINELMKKLPFVLRLAFYYVTAVMIIAMGVFSSGGEFIYFQF